MATYYYMVHLKSSDEPLRIEPCTIDAEEYLHQLRNLSEGEFVNARKMVDYPEFQADVTGERHPAKSEVIEPNVSRETVIRDLERLVDR